MANSFYDAYMRGIQGEHATRVVLSTDPIDVALVDNGSADGAPDAVNDDFWDDQDAGVIGTPYRLVNKTLSGAGIFDNTVNPAPAFTGVSGASVESLVFFKNTGTPSTSNLICFFDTGVTNLPFVPNGGDVNLTFNASGIWKV